MNHKMELMAVSTAFTEKKEIAIAIDGDLSALFVYDGAGKEWDIVLFVPENNKSVGHYSIETYLKEIEPQLALAILKAILSDNDPPETNIMIILRHLLGGGFRRLWATKLIDLGPIEHDQYKAIGDQINLIDKSKIISDAVDHSGPYKELLQFYLEANGEYRVEHLSAH